MKMSRADRNPWLAKMIKRGCLVYTKEGLNVLQLDSKIYQFVEYVQLEIHFENGEKLLISCIYRSPSATTTTCIEGHRRTQ